MKLNWAQAQTLLRTTRADTVWWENQKPETTAYQIKQKVKGKAGAVEINLTYNKIIKYSAMKEISTSGQLVCALFYNEVDVTKLAFNFSIA